MMQARNLILAVIGGGTLFGTLGGLAIGTDMKPPPDPAWRQAVQASGASGGSYQLVDSGPQDLSPGWYGDRTPTWKRGLAYQPATYVTLRDPYPAEPADTAGTATNDQAPTVAIVDHAAAGPDSDAAQTAQTPVGAPDAAEQQGGPDAGDAPAAL